MNTGVYAILNTSNGKQYIGSAFVSFENRWSVHRRELNKGIHSNRHLQNAWNKYGKDSFEFKILLRCAPSDCIRSEILLIAEHKSSDKNFGYNEMQPKPNMFGFKHSEDTRKRMSVAHTNPSAEFRAKISAAMKGRKHTKEARAKISAGNKGKLAGRKLPKDHPFRMWWVGKKHRAETKVKMSNANKGKVFSPETRAKMSASAKARGASPGALAAFKKYRDSQKGVPRSADVRAKISASHKGKKFTIEHRNSLGRAQRLRWERQYNGITLMEMLDAS